MITKAKETAGFYLRMSSTKQKDSPDRQRGIVLPYAEVNAYEIVEEYLDDGISGLKTTEREAFQRLIKDAKAGKFDVVLCECVDRFGRLDLVDSGEWVSQLKDAGVKLVCVKEGVIDFNSFVGRITFGLHTELGNEWLKGHAHKTLSGKLQAVKAGRWPFSIAPFGYMRIYHNEHGEIVHRAYFDEKFTKPKTWSCTLAISDREDSEIIKWLFTEYVTTSTSVRGLRVDLNNRGIPSPQGCLWNDSGIRYFLSNRAYVGCLQIGKNVRGELYRTGEDGGIKDGSKSREVRKVGPVTREDTFPPIIDKATFATVQAKLQSRQKIRITKNGYLLAGMVCCGHCGRTLLGGRSRQGSSPMYRCRSKNQQRGDCPAYGIDAKLIDSYLVGIVQNSLSEKSMTTLRKKLMEKQKSRRGNKSSKGTSIKRRLNALESKIKKGLRRCWSLQDRILQICPRRWLNGEGNGTH